MENGIRMKFKLRKNLSIENDDELFENELSKTPYLKIVKYDTNSGECEFLIYDEVYTEKLLKTLLFT